MSWALSLQQQVWKPLYIVYQDEYVYIPAWPPKGEGGLGHMCGQAPTPELLFQHSDKGLFFSSRKLRAASDEKRDNEVR